ncbi:MAG: hypothetical protein LBN27_13535 [Prevotellaceae bacterium]|jgi:hypothetical protein|nr:hypothetical protein [Prevotellaceae bacterium]
MEEQDKDINIIFKPQIGLGDILFSFQENDIVKILGNPDEREIDVFNSSEYAINLYYYKINIHPSIYYENGEFDYSSISTEDIILDNVKFSSLTKDEIVKFIDDYHNKHGLQYLCKYEYEEDVNEECYFFENIGFTIWFEENTISDICVQRRRH